jgi:hypothetical protein
LFAVPDGRRREGLALRIGLSRYWFVLRWRLLGLQLLRFFGNLHGI